MNPESRIKLLRLLEEIKLYQQNNLDWRKNSYFGIIFYLIYPVIMFFVMDKPFKQSYLFFLMLIPAATIFLWLRFRNKLEERYKLLASTVLELGSVAQEVPFVETKEEKIIPKTLRRQKKLLKPKKK